MLIKIKVNRFFLIKLKPKKNFIDYFQFKNINIYKDKLSKLLNTLTVL